MASWNPGPEERAAFDRLVDDLGAGRLVNLLWHKSAGAEQ